MRDIGLEKRAEPHGGCAIHRPSIDRQEFVQPLRNAKGEPGWAGENRLATVRRYKAAVRFRTGSIRAETSSDSPSAGRSKPATMMTLSSLRNTREESRSNVRAELKTWRKKAFH